MADAEESNPTDPTEDRTAGRARFSPAFVLIALVTTLFAAFISELVPAVADLEVHISDQWLKLGRPATPDPRLIYVEIDKTSYADELPDSLLTSADVADLPVLLALQGEFPWNRAVFARLAEKLMNAGAKGVALNFKFSSQRDGDEYFQQVITNHAPGVVVGGLIEMESGLITLIQPSPSIVPTDEFGENIHSPSVGVLNIHTDLDDIVRHGLYRMDYLNLATQAMGPSAVKELGIESLILHTLSARVVQLLGEEAKLPPPAVRPRIRFAGAGGTFPVVSMGHVMNPATWQSEFNSGEYFRDKVILVGPGPMVFDNSHSTPNGEMSATELQLNYINAALQGDFIHPSGRLANIALTFLTGLLALILASLIRPPLARVATGLLLSLALAGLLVSLASQSGILLQSCIAPVLLLNTLMILRHCFNAPETRADVQCYK